MDFIKTDTLGKEALHAFFTTHWGSPVMVLSTGQYDCLKLEGYAALNDNKEMVGLITFEVRGKECEIISLDSLEENNGTGSALLEKAEEAAKEQGCSFITLITTNDNLNALRFYQKRGYHLVELLANAVEKARAIKPEIPLKGFFDIPIRDELKLRKELV